MKGLVHLRKRAEELRRQGFTYNEILRDISVAKSTLSGWLKDLPLTDEEKVVLKKRKDKNISRGRIKAAGSLRKRRLDRERQYLKEARKEFEQFHTNPLFCIGIALYWAEGSKRGSSFSFTNSDEEMIKTFIAWIEEFVGMSRQDLSYRLFIHKHYAHEDCESQWSKCIGVSKEKFKKTVYKPTRKLYKKRPNYKGCFRVGVPKGKKLLYKMKVWQNMLAVEYASARSSAD